ncbi:MAG: hypothetical protein U0441_14385 [Polyangiaceae bacterium]
MKPDEPEIDPALPTTVTASGRVVYDPLRARRVEVEPAPTGDVGELLRDLRALDEQDARDVVPAPVSLTPSEGGALVTGPAQEAARAHVEAQVPAPAPQGHVDSAPVKIVDPRRLPTVRVETKGPPAALEAETRTRASSAADTRAHAPNAPPAEPPASRRAGLAIAAISVTAVLAFVAFRAWRDDGSSGAVTPQTSTSAASASETTSDPSTTFAPTTSSSPDAVGTTTSSEPEQPAPTTHDPKSPTGTATGAHTATPPSTTTVTTTRTATPPSATATETPAATTAPNAPQTAAPAVSSAPTTKSGGSTPPSDTTFVIQPKGTIP